MTGRVKFMLNASYSVLEYRDGKLTPLEYAVSEHLTESSFYRI